MPASKEIRRPARRWIGCRPRCGRWCSAAIALLTALGASQRAEAQLPYERRTVRAARAAGPISIDGVLDEPAWQAAEVGTGLIQTEPDDGAPATAATRFRVLWDDAAIYVGIECDD